MRTAEEGRIENAYVIDARAIWSEVVTSRQREKLGLFLTVRQSCGI